VKSKEIKPSKGRGGAGRGQGRKPNISKVLKQAVADAVFQVFGGERQAWEKLAKEAETKDLRLFFDVLRYWSDQSHGKAAQPFRHSGPEDGEPMRMIMEDIGSKD
jgi:hypothetical protein